MQDFVDIRRPVRLPVAMVMISDVAKVQREMAVAAAVVLPPTGSGDPFQCEIGASVFDQSLVVKAREAM